MNGISSGFMRLGANVNSDWLKRLATDLVAMPPVQAVPNVGMGLPMLHVSDAARDAEIIHDPTSIGAGDMTREQATSLGFTGDVCSHCGSLRMQHTGHCDTCAECGTTTGCS